VASVCGIILAGGRSSRMNPAGEPPHSKARIELAGEPLLAHVVSRLRPQVATLLISANRELDWFRRFAAPVVVDLLPDHPGPLAGLLSGAAYLLDSGADCEWVCVAPCDGPFVPTDLVARLLEAADDTVEVACPSFRGQLQPTFSLWRRSALDRPAAELMALGTGGFKPLMSQLASVEVAWPDDGSDPFFNINSREDLLAAEALGARRAGG